MRRTRLGSARWTWGCAFLLVGTLAGCGAGASGGDGDHEASPTATASKAATRPIHDSPSAFDTSQGILLPRSVLDGHINLAGQVGNGDLPVTLYEDNVFIAQSSRMQMRDMTAGKLTTVADPAAAPVGADDEWNVPVVEPPLLVKQGSDTIAITSFVVNETATGTQAAHQAAEIIAVDAGTGKAAWRVTIQLPDRDGQDATVSLAGADGGTLVFRAITEYEHSVSYGIDLATRRQVWSEDGFAAYAVADGGVVGAAEDKSGGERPGGVDAATGKSLWRGQWSADVSASTIGSGRILLSGSDYESGDEYDRVVAPRTGRPAVTLADEVSGTECVYDDQATLICLGSSGADDAVYGLDATSGKLLWQLPDTGADRIAPSVSVVWHGRVYGTANDAPVMLDARTGEDLASPSVAPIMVNESIGIMLSKPDRTLVACPAKG